MIPGIFASNQGIVGDRAGDFASAILQIAPTGSALLLALSSGMMKSGANDTVFTWFEDVHIAGRQAIASGGTSTSVVVADGSGYVPGQVLLVEETGEYLYVTAVNGNTLTVTRSMGGTTLTSVNNTMHTQLIGNAQSEGSGMPTAVTQQGHARMNYTQIFRNAWGVTGTAKAVTYRTGSKVANSKKQCAMFHSEDIERSIIWGVKHVGQLAGKPFRMTDGIKTQLNQYGAYQVSAATGSVAGNFSRVDFEDFLMNVFSKNVKGQPNERISFGGQQVLKVLNNMTMLDGRYEITQGESKVGITVTTIVTPFGTLKLMTHPLMNENPTWQKELYVLHPGAIRRRVLRETFEENYDSNGTRISGVDADQGAITSEMGIEIGAASTMGILSNVNKAVAST